MRFKPFLLAPVVLVIVAGCGATQTPADIATQSAINAGLQGKGNVQVDQGTVNYQGENGSTMRYGENVTLPDGFPADVKVYTGANINLVNHNPGEESASLSLQTSDPLATVMTWYEGQYADWTKEGTSSFSGQEMRQYKKDGVQVTIIAAGADDVTTVTIARQKSSS